MDPTRPYPEGIAWDEAWRHRQAADRLREELAAMHRQHSSLNDVAGKWRARAEAAEADAALANEALKQSPTVKSLLRYKDACSQIAKLRAVVEDSTVAAILKLQEIASDDCAGDICACDELERCLPCRAASFLNELAVDVKRTLDALEGK